MKNKCKCGAEVIWGNQCYDCAIKEDKIAFAILLGFVVVVLGIIFGIRLIWANVVFDDWRCALSECRIIK